MFVPQQRPKRGNIIQRSINLVEICWTLTGNHPKLLLAHAISLTASLLAGWVFIVPNYFFVHASIPHALFGVFLLFALASLGILIGNVVLIVGAQRILDGHAPSLREGFRVAAFRLPQLIGWVVIAAIVGTVMKVIQGMIERISSIGGFLFGMAAELSWGLATYFVVPLMIIEGQGPIEAIRASTELAGKSWIREVLGDVSLGLAFLLFSIPGFLVAWFYPSGQILALLYFIPLVIAYGVTTSIYQAALYRFAMTGEVPQKFEPVFAPEVS